MRIDLHTHTNFSACADKINTWEALLRKAEIENIELLSITDHNTCVFHLLEKFVDTSQFFSGKQTSYLHRLSIAYSPTPGICGC